MRAFTELRDVTITITGAPAPIDFYDAVIQKVKDSETLYENDSDQTNITAEPSVLTGKTPYKVYTYDATVNWSTGVYTFAYTGVYPNVESIPAEEDNGDDEQG